MITSVPYTEDVLLYNVATLAVIRLFEPSLVQALALQLRSKVVRAPAQGGGQTAPHTHAQRSAPSGGLGLCGLGLCTCMQKGIVRAKGSVCMAETARRPPWWLCVGPAARREAVCGEKLSCEFLPSS